MNVLEKQLLEIQEKLEEVKLWQSLIDNPTFQDKRCKFQNVMEKANKILIDFAQQRIDFLQGKQTSTIPVSTNKSLPENMVKIEGKNNVAIKNIAPPPLKLDLKDKRAIVENYKNKQVPSPSQPNDFGLGVGDKAKLISTMSISAVNEVQASKFVPGDVVKIVKVYRNQYGEDVAEIVKGLERGIAAKAVISIEDLQ